MKRALLMGIDTYKSFPPLKGCVNDVNMLEPLLGSNEDGSPNFEVIARKSDRDSITRDSMLSDLEDLLASGADLALFYFAGHGDVAQKDLHLVTSDGTHRNAGLTFSRILTMIQESKVPEVIAMLDCCFAGTAGGAPILGGDTLVLRKGVTILTATRANEEALETAGGQGLFSSYLCGALEGGAADTLGKVSVPGLYSYLSESFGAWGQRPMFKAHLDRLHDVRKCNPVIPLLELRRITEFFPKSSSIKDLDPSYEPTSPTKNERNCAIFAILQKYRANRLLEPVGTEHMYYAAVDSKSCRLTPLGRHYWHLVSKKRV